MRSFRRNFWVHCWIGLMCFQAQSALSYPVKPLSVIYRLEKADKLHRIGFVADSTKPSLEKKLGEFEKLEQSSDESWPWRGKFWSWLDGVGNGQEIPSVQYLLPEERQEYQIEFKNNAISSPILDSIQAVQATQAAQAIKTSDRLNVIFVMDSEGAFYVGVKVRGSSEVRAFQHSSFFGGEPVAGAGSFEIETQTGKIKKVSSSSGHYRFQAAELPPMFEALKNKGVSLEEIEFDLEAIEFESRDLYQFALKRGNGHSISIPKWLEIHSRYVDFQNAASDSTVQTPPKKEP